jgi:hypothetical protein
MYHAKQVIYAEIENDILKIRDIRRERAYTSTRNEKPQIPVSGEIEDVNDLPKVIFSEMEHFIDVLRNSDKKINNKSGTTSKGLRDDRNNDPILPFYEIGQRVKIQWTSDDIGDSG